MPTGGVLTNLESRIYNLETTGLSYIDYHTRRILYTYEPEIHPEPDFNYDVESTTSTPVKAIQAVTIPIDGLVVFSGNYRTQEASYAYSLSFIINNKELVTEWPKGDSHDNFWYQMHLKAGDTASIGYKIGHPFPTNTHINISVYPRRF